MTMSIIFTTPVEFACTRLVEGPPTRRVEAPPKIPVKNGLTGNGAVYYLCIGRPATYLNVRVRMTNSSKLESYKQHMAANGVGESAAFPPAWNLLWSVGIKIPPPPFLGFVSLVLISGGFFGPVFGIGAWLLGNRGVREMPANEALWVALITGVAFGVVMAAYYRHMARKHQLASWAAFSSTARRT